MNRITGMELTFINNLGTSAAEVLHKFHGLKQDIKDHIAPLTYSQAEMHKLLKHTNRPIAANTLSKEMQIMADNGYEFQRTAANGYILSRADCIAIAEHLGVEKYRHTTNGKAFVFQVGSLKGGVGKSLGTNFIASALINIPKYLLKDMRVLIVDLDPQATSTQHNAPFGSMTESTYTSIAMMCSDVDKIDIQQNGIIRNGKQCIDIIPCSTLDGFYADELDLPETRGENKYQELLFERLIKKFENDYDFILLDAGPHMDKVLKNCLNTINGMYIPVPPTFYDFDSTLNFISRLPTVMKQLVEEGLDLSNLDFIKPYLSMVSTSENAQDKEIYENASTDLYEIFGFENVIKAPLPKEDVYQRCAENGATVFTIKAKDYPGSNDAFKRARDAAELWAKELIDGMISFHKKKGN